MPIFEDVDPKYLARIAANLVPKTFKYGEFLVKQGQVPKGLFVILKGQCRVLATRIAERPLNSAQEGAAGSKGRGHSKSQRNNQWQSFIRDPLISDFNPTTSVLNQTGQTPALYQNKRMYVENNREIKKSIQYLDQMTFSQLTRGESFGARTVVPFEYYTKMKVLFFGQRCLERHYPVGCNRDAINAEDFETYHTKSLLSIVADSHQVQVWVLDNADMNYLTALDQERVFDRIAALREPDRPLHQQDIDFIVDQFQKWDQYKVDCVEGLLLRNQMENYFNG